MKQILSFLYLSLISLLAACSSGKVAVSPPPKQNYTPVAFKIENSNIMLPVVVKISDLQQLINAQYSGILYKDSSFDDNQTDNLKVTVTKISNISLNASNDVISIKIPLKIDVEGRFKQEVLSMAIEKTKASSFNIVVNAKSKIAFSPDWQIISKTETNFDWITTPYLEMGLLRLPIGFAIEKIVNYKLKDISATLDKSIAKEIPLKKYAENMWKQVQQPQMVNDTYKAWLTIKPQELQVAPIFTKNDSIQLPILFKGQIFLKTGERPNPSSLVPLPKLTIAPLTSNDYNLRMQTEIPWQQALIQAQPYVLNKTFKDEKEKSEITVNDLELYGTENKMVIGIGVKGYAKSGFVKKKIDGKIYLQGIPYYDKTKQEIRLTEFDYALKTRDVLLKSANWLLKGTFRKQVEPFLAFSVKENINELYNTSNSMLSNYKFTDQINITGKVRSLDIDGIYVSEQGIILTVISDGNVKINIK